MKSDVPQLTALTAGRRRKWTLAAYRYMARKRLAHKAEINLKNLAVKSWDISPGEVMHSPPAFFLPGQMARVTGWEAKRFYPYEHPSSTMEGLGDVVQGATRGYLLKDVWLIDGDRQGTAAAGRAAHLRRGHGPHQGCLRRTGG